MMPESRPKASVNIRTPQGTVIHARLAEAPVRVLLDTPQVLCQVVVVATHHKGQKELVGRRDA